MLFCILGPVARASAAADPGDREPERVLEGSQLQVTEVAISPATGNPRLVRVAGERLLLKGKTAADKAMALLIRYGSGFGLTDPARELKSTSSRLDALGGEHVDFRQTYHGVPVFGAGLRVHFNPTGALDSVNGHIVSGIDLDPVPSTSDQRAERSALEVVAKRTGRSTDEMTVTPPRLVVYRSGLVRGVPGRNHLSWEVHVEAKPDLHEVVYVDAHDGRIVDRRSEIHPISRVVHQSVMPNPIWSEGDPLPYSGGNPAQDEEINGLVSSAADTYSLFANLTHGQYLSFDGDDGTMNSIYDATTLTCPNAVESGGVTAFCVGMVSDDVAAHEWTHAYTEWTHNLIYQWQPGALNEATSDIFGELVDQLNGRGSDIPGGVRSPNTCSLTGGTPQPTFTIVAPPSIAGAYPIGGATFNPPPPWTVTGSIELADDGSGTTSDGCQPLLGFTVGAIALVDRGECLFRDKVVNAQSAGATAVIVVNNQGNEVLEMLGDPPRLLIPAVFIGQGDGGLIKAALVEGVEATMIVGGSFDDSLRWLVGEDTTALGAIRDMWSPSCFGDPDRVGSASYYCRSMDSGGVHTNSGIPNHAFALLVDGGTYNGFTVDGIGHNKAARIYWRSMAYYQTPVTGFADHADLLEVSCHDLIGAPLYDLQTGNLEPESVSGHDCDQVAAAVNAVEMRLNPSQCGFATLLDPAAPAVGGNLVVFAETFDSDPGPTWARNNHGVFPEYEARDWVWTEDSPEGGDGGAFFGIDSVFIGDCRPGSDDQSGVMELSSPEIALPRNATKPVLTFDHWIATESDWDGGNVKLSVNGGGFLEIPGSAFLFNRYNARIVTGNTNPLAGQLAFTGSDDGTLSGSWGQSQIDLASFAGPGDRIRLRFDLGVDGCNGVEGWYLDNVRLVATAVAPRLSGGRVTP
jgi:Zn-dependent metalloprotease